MKTIRFIFGSTVICGVIAVLGEMAADILRDTKVCREKKEEKSK